MGSTRARLFGIVFGVILIGGCGGSGSADDGLGRGDGGPGGAQSIGGAPGSGTGGAAAGAGGTGVGAGGAGAIGIDVCATCDFSTEVCMESAATGGKKACVKTCAKACGGCTFCSGDNACQPIDTRPGEWPYALPAACNAGTGGSAGGTGGAGGSSGIRMCRSSSDCADPATQSCVERGSSTACETSCPLPCTDGSICIGGNACQLPGGQPDGPVITADQRRCEVDCNRATSVCLAMGTAVWTCTPLCAVENSTGSLGCLDGSHCVNETQVPGWPGTGGCLWDGNPGDPCGLTNYCKAGACNPATKVCP